ncbi:MAG TPA: metallophosphoesterase [Burkholderiaceae bacterium]|nr:metallophosphoesterase [Burkholderiaceae bacterium]
MGLLLLAALHVYIGVRLAPALPMAGGLAVVTALLGLWALLVSTTATVFGRRSAPAWLAWAGLIAVGFFSSLLVLTVLRDAVLLAAAAARAGGWPPPASLAAMTTLAVPALAAAASLLGFLNARRRPAVRHVDVPIAGLPPALEGFSIVQISDLHVGPTIRHDFVQRVVDRVNSLAPDLTVVTGDVVDGRVADLQAHTQPLGQLQARHGVFAVTGNHEYYSGAAEWIAEFRRLGITTLMNEHRLLQHGGARFVLAGVADYSAHHFDPAHRSDPQQALRGAPDDAGPKVLLAHQPRSAQAAAEAGFDLQLSGHTHGGQFLPWNLFVPLQQPYTAGLHRHGRMWVYISRGTGYWGPPKRLGAPSEITRLRLVTAAAQQ